MICCFSFLEVFILMDIMITPNKLESILEMPLADDIKTN